MNQDSNVSSVNAVKGQEAQDTNPKCKCGKDATMLILDAHPEFMCDDCYMATVKRGRWLVGWFRRKKLWSSRVEKQTLNTAPS
jgi:hypothetical protein